MSPIIAAIITAVIGPAVTLLIRRYLEASNLLKMTGSRLALIGDWVGTATYSADGDFVSFPVRFTFTSGRRRVEGVAEYVLPDAPTVRLALSGGFVFDHLLILNYENKALGTKQHGTYVAELHSNGRTLTGKYAGFGLESNKPIYGSVTLQKDPRA